MRMDSVVKILQRIFAMQTTSLYDRQNPLDETAAGFAIAAEAASTPQYGATQQTFDVVVGRFYPLLRHERPQRGFQGQHVFAEFRDAGIVAEAALHQGVAEAAPQRLDQRLQLAPRDLA